MERTTKYGTIHQTCVAIAVRDDTMVRGVESQPIIPIKFVIWLLTSSHVQRPGRLMLISGVISFRSSSWMSQTTTENRRLLHHHRLALFFLPHILFSRCNVSGKESNSFTFFDVSNKMMGTILPSMMCFPHINEFPLTNCKRLLRL